MGIYMLYSDNIDKAQKLTKPINGQFSSNLKLNVDNREILDRTPC